MTYTSLGKQVLCHGKHFADAVSEDAAKLIADSLNLGVIMLDDGK